MRIVREYIEFNKMDFDRSESPKEKLDIGERHRIESWLKEMGFDEDEYRINSDWTIDILDDANLIGHGMEELPNYINFNRIYGGFYAGGNSWKSLKGFPKKVDGDLQINSESAPSKNMRKFTEEEIRKIIQVNGKIYLI